MTANKRISKFDSLPKDKRLQLLEKADIGKLDTNSIQLCWHKQQRLIKAALENNINIGESIYTDTITNKKMKRNLNGKFVEAD